MKSLWSQPPMVDAILRTSAYTHNASILYPDIHAATIGAKHAGRLNPMIGFFSSSFINTCWPVVYKGFSFSPDIVDAIACFLHVAIVLTQRCTRNSYAHLCLRRCVT